MKKDTWGWEGSGTLLSVFWKASVYNKKLARLLIIPSQAHYTKAPDALQQLYINALVMDAFYCVRDLVPKPTWIPLEGQLGNEVFQDLNP